MKYRYYIIGENYEVRGTNDPKLALEVAAYEIVIDSEEGIEFNTCTNGPTEKIAILPYSDFGADGSDSERKDVVGDDGEGSSDPD